MKYTRIACLLAAAVTAGCAGDPHYVSKDDPQGNYKVPSIENTYELVGAGKPPLSLVVTSGGWVKVLDVTTRELVHTAQLPADNDGLAVKLDPELKAITYSNVKAEKPVIVLPINPDDRYEIYYER